MRQSWTDDRLDEFGRRIDDRFDHVDRRFDRVEAEMDLRFRRVETEMKALRSEMIEGNRERRAEFAAFHRTLIQLGGGVIVALIVVLATQL